ncbi:MAG: cytochrome c family protein [Desulfobacteraceae bacterium]|nr:MAG: cytochrome c family protein [Desulfobacteraceae bacterium]
MLKNIFISILAFGMLLGISGQALAEEQGNERKGKFTYQKLYKSCHEKGVISSSKPPISPDAKTQAQWKRVFDKKNFTEFGCEQEWATLDEQQLLNIHAYLHAHAADSPSPAKCK